MQIEIQPLGNEQWFISNKQHTIDEIVTMIQHTAIQRACDQLRQLKHKKRDKHTRQVYTPPTILTGSTLRIAFTFDSRKNGSSQLLVTNFTRASSAKACTSYEIFHEKLLVYVLPIEDFLSSLKQNKAQAVSHLRQSGENPSVSDYFSKSSHPPQLNSDKKRTLQAMMKKPLKKKKAVVTKSSASTNVRCTFDARTGDNPIVHTRDKAVHKDDDRSQRILSGNSSSPQSHSSHVQMDLEKVQGSSLVDSVDVKCTYSRDSDGIDPISFYRTRNNTRAKSKSDVSSDNALQVKACNTTSESEGTQSRTNENKVSRDMSPVKTVRRNLVQRDSQPRFKFKKTAKQTFKHSFSEASVVSGERINIIETTSSDSNNQCALDLSPLKANRSTITEKHQTDSDASKSSKQKYGLDVSPIKDSACSKSSSSSKSSSATEQKYGLDISPFKKNIVRPSASHAESEPSKLPKRQFGLDLSSENEDFILEPIKKKRKKTAKLTKSSFPLSPVVKVRRCLKRKPETSSETSDTIADVRHSRMRPHVTKTRKRATKADKNSDKYLIKQSKEMNHSDTSNSNKDSVVQRRKDVDVNSESVDVSVIEVQSSSKESCSKDTASVGDMKQTCAWSNMSSSLDERGRSNGWTVNADKLRSYLSGKSKSSAKQSSSSYDAVSDHYTNEPVLPSICGPSASKISSNSDSRQDNMIKFKTRRRFAFQPPSFSSTSSSVRTTPDQSSCENKAEIVISDDMQASSADTQEEAEDIFKDCIILEELSWDPSKQNTSMENAIHNLEKVSDLSAEELEYLVQKNEHYLRQIFQGKVYNRRHEDYKKGGKAKVDLMYQINVGLYREDQHDTVMQTLMKMFCRRHDKYFDYVMRVMLPEILIKIYMEVHGATHDETERAMCEALNTPGAIFT